MSRILRVSLILLLASGLLPAAEALAAAKAKSVPSYALPVTPSYKRLADQTNDFYAWYVGALNAGIYPVEAALDELRKYVSDRFMRQIIAAPKRIDGDYFLCAQKWDPAWETGSRVAKVNFDQGIVRQDVVLTGSQGEHRVIVYLVQEGSAWKIDRVEPGPR